MDCQNELNLWRFGIVCLLLWLMTSVSSPVTQSYTILSLKLLSVCYKIQVSFEKVWKVKKRRLPYDLLNWEKTMRCLSLSTLNFPVLHHRGFVLLRDQMYLIEPLAGAEAGQQGDTRSSKTYSDEGLHAIYNHKHLRRKRSSCSHGNTTTFYDHGARSSGLFQLSSLVKTQRGHIHLHTRVWNLQRVCLEGGR